MKTHSDLNPMHPTSPKHRSEELMARTLGRLVALIILLVGGLTVAVGLSACDDDDDNPDADWYLSGQWANNVYPNDEMYFFNNGTGYWMSNSSGESLDFNYYCNDDDIYFTFFPVGAPSYSLDCDIDMINGRNMIITWPPSSIYGPVTIPYYRVN